MYYLVLTVYFASINGTVNIYVDDFRSEKYCEMAKVRYIETHITDLVERKQTYTNIKRIDCIKVEKG